MNALLRPFNESLFQFGRFLMDLVWSHTYNNTEFPVKALSQAEGEKFFKKTEGDLLLAKAEYS